MQLQATLDDSLLHRAESTVDRDPVRPQRPTCPPEYLGAADVWVACLDGGGNGLIRARTAERAADAHSATRRSTVVQGDDAHVGPHHHRDDGTRWRVVAVHRDDGPARW